MARPPNDSNKPVPGSGTGEVLASKLMSSIENQEGESARNSSAEIPLKFAV